jgi:hypothetical protein
MLMRDTTFTIIHRAETFHFAAETKLMAALYRTNRVKQAARLAVAKLLAELFGTFSRSTWGRSTGGAAWSVAGPRPLESLEGRQLMSAGTVALVDGVLEVTGNSTVASALSVQPTSSSDSYYTANAGNGQLLTVPASSIKAVLITGGTGADTIYVDQSVTVPVTINGGGGNDGIRGGGGPNTISVPSGNAWVNARGSADYITAGNGNVTLLGGPGNDTMIAGNGNDSLNGGAGNDSMVVGNGNDSVYGTTGNDTLVAGNGTDTLDGGAGNDSIVTGTGTDSVYPSIGTNTVVEGSAKTSIDDNYGTDTVLTSSGATVAGSAGQTSGSTSSGSTTAGSTAWTTYTAAAPASGSPQAVLQVLDPDAMVGGGVVVRGLNSTLGAGTDANANFVWNFGDASGAHNVLSGYNASHVYATAGTYTISLTVTNVNGKSSTATATVTIAPDTRTKIYVNAVSGNDADNGLTPATAVKTVARGAALLGDDTELLFARGETFDLANTVDVQFSNVLVGAYGSGADPVIDNTDPAAATASFDALNSASIGVTIQDLQMTTEGGVNFASVTDPPVGVDAGGYDISVLRCTFQYIGYGVDAAGQPVGLTVFDSASPNQDGLDAYFVWGQGTDLAIVGNTAVNSEHEHIVRTYATEQLVADNTFANSDGKGCIEIQTGSYAWVDGNTVTGGDIRFGPHGGSSEPATTVDEYGVIQNNVIYQSFINIDPGAQHVFIRNNAIYTSTGGYCIGVVAQDAYGRQVSDVSIVNNTGVETQSSYGTFLTVYGYVDGMALVNNLYVAPTMTSGSGAAPVDVFASSLAGWTVDTNNVWQMPVRISLWAQGGINIVGTTYVQSAEQTAAEWNALTPGGSDVFAPTSLNDSTFAPATNSVAATAGEVYGGVYGDLNGDARPTSGTWSAGAVQV